MFIMVSETIESLEKQANTRGFHFNWCIVCLRSIKLQNDIDYSVQEIQFKALKQGTQGLCLQKCKSARMSAFWLNPGCPFG